jgi:hypothetical protein
MTVDGEGFMGRGCAVAIVLSIYKYTQDPGSYHAVFGPKVLWRLHRRVDERTVGVFRNELERLLFRAERTRRFIDRLKLAWGSADVSIQGYSWNGPGTAKMGFLSPGELALNTGLERRIDG